MHVGCDIDDSAFYLLVKAVSVAGFGKKSGKMKKNENMGRTGNSGSNAKNAKEKEKRHPGFFETGVILDRCVFWLVVLVTLMRVHLCCL